MKRAELIKEVKLPLKPVCLLVFVHAQNSNNSSTITVLLEFSAQIL